jgi:GDP-4-dehydro-6-deoxy-D-mannose reductase
MKIIRVRPFNITGPRRTNDVCSDFARRIIEVEKERRKIVEVGNLEPVRDITDIRDAVKALWLLAEKGKHGEAYNLCTGRGYSVREILDKLMSLSSERIEIKQDASKMRPFDDVLQIGDNSKLREIGWKPEIPIEKTLADMMDYWRDKK